MPAVQRSCPALSASLVPPDSVPLSPTAPWQPAIEPPARPNSTHFFMYAPDMITEADQHTFRAVLHANQFPANPAACNRTLLLYDDALTAGLGYTARLIAISTLVAIQERRVLIYVPHSTARWCGRAPHTLGCYYEPSTHCTIPQNLSDTSKWSTRGSSFGYEARLAQSKAHVRISTSQVHRSTFWYKFHPSVKLYSAIYDLFFKPRPWIQQLAECTMRAASLRHGNFAVVHARYSVEKKKERGARLPVLTEYLPATEALLAYANVSRIFLQTSTPEAVRLFESWSAEHNWQLSYTQNIRSTNDPWMTGKGKKEEYKAAGERESVVAQAVNAHIASRAQHFLSPTSSMWTMFIRALMGRQVQDRVTSPQSSDDAHEECHLSQNVSKEAMKRCNKKSPLMSVHRHPGPGSGNDEY